MTSKLCSNINLSLLRNYFHRVRKIFSWVILLMFSSKMTLKIVFEYKFTTLEKLFSSSAKNIFESEFIITDVENDPQK